MSFLDTLKFQRYPRVRVHLMPEKVLQENLRRTFWYPTFREVKGKIHRFTNDNLHQKSLKYLLFLFCPSTLTSKFPTRIKPGDIPERYFHSQLTNGVGGRTGKRIQISGITLGGPSSQQTWAEKWGSYIKLFKVKVPRKLNILWL